MNQQTFKHINQVLARDSKSATYKFALLRGTIELVEENSPFIVVKNNRAYFPLELLVEKWLIYYYPLMDVPQINSNTQLAFATLLREVVDFYELRGGLSTFYRDLRSLPKEIEPVVKTLKKKIAATITQMPMRYIGRSVFGKHYGLYEYGQGQFSIPAEYYEAFQVLGSFVTGQDAILFKWAEFSVQTSGKTLSVTQVLNEVLKSPITERDILESKALYRRILETDGKVFCVWTGNALNRYDIDHIIPFTIWKNNDLWNLLPASPSANNKKRDKIPSPALLDAQQELIRHYWGLLYAHKQQRFQQELQQTLLGYSQPGDWQGLALNQLKNSCDYLINTRGLEGWDG